MRNVIILGSGRSGTSMVAGTLAKAGYYMGGKLHPPRPTNPKGFFEDEEINIINEEILSKTVPRRPPLLGRWFFRDRPLTRQRWLARVPVGAKLFSSRRIRAHIQGVTNNNPFCFKDPRFSYTIPAWRPFLKNTVFVCVFREPASTAMSILKECSSRKYLQSLNIDFAIAIEAWALMYSHILQIHRYEGKWLFLHYNQVLTEQGLDRLESFTEAKVDRSFPDKSLRKNLSDKNVPNEISEIYKELCKLAEFDGI